MLQLPRTVSGSATTGDTSELLSTSQSLEQAVSTQDIHLETASGIRPHCSQHSVVTGDITPHLKLDFPGYSQRFPTPINEDLTLWDKGELYTTKL